MNTLTTTKTKNQARKITMIDVLDVALPEATPSPFGCVSLHSPRCARAPLGGQMRSAPRNKFKNLDNYIDIVALHCGILRWKF